MAAKNNLGPSKALARLVKLQVAIALCAIAVTLVLSFKIPKLIQTKSQLEADVRILEAKKRDLQEKKDETQRDYTKFFLQVQSQNPKLAREAINPDAPQVTPR